MVSCNTINCETLGWTYFDPEEVGFKESLQLFHEVKNSTGTTPTVIDATDLLESPGKRFLQVVLQRV